jgi:hypothetical protein
VIYRNLLISKQEFEEFCKNKALDITTEKFKNLELSQYKFEGLEPLLKLEDGNHTVLNLLLSRTFSDKLNMQEIKEIYTKLYNLDDIAREKLIYTAALISQNNTIKIVFGEGTSSYYAAEQNIIKVENNFISEPIFNTESVLIHEIGHFVYEQINNNKALPFSLKSLKTLAKNIAKNIAEDFEDPFIQATAIYKIISDQKQISQFMNTAKDQTTEILEYEKVARVPVDKAAELLLVDSKEYDKYLFTQEYTEYFKLNSYIDLFFLNALAGFKADKVACQATADHVFDNILKMYMSLHNTCANTHPFLPDITRAEIEKWATEEYLPQIVKELNLSSEQVHFLDRIADYINRGEHLLDDSGDENDKYVELIVRSQELKAAGLSSELTDSFKGLDQFHITHVSQHICEAIQSSEVASMVFDIEMIGEAYECLNSNS